MTEHTEGEATTHAWRYFELHAKQRISVFNFFIAFSGLVSAGIVGCLQGPPSLALTGILLSLLLALLSFLFWKLDTRTAFLVKHAERALTALEKDCFPPSAQLFATEPARSEGARREQGLWSYSEAFRLIFVIMGCMSIAGAALCTYRVITYESRAQGPATERPGLAK
jgi:hypothetical protein